MLKFPDIAGAIFDVDDTLLNNFPPEFGSGLHEYSRLRAVHEVGRRHNKAALRIMTMEQSVEAFARARVHTLEAAVWEMLVMAGEVADGPIEPTHPLLVEIVRLKDELHEATLRTYGRPVPGAVDFVRACATAGLAGHMAIASTAYRRDVEIFLEMTDLKEVFAPEKIITRELLSRPKPDPQAFDLAFAVLGLPEGMRVQVVAFEDDPRGIMSAKAAGLYVCAITTRFSRADLEGLAVPPDMVAESFAEFRKLLKM